MTKLRTSRMVGVHLMYNKHVAMMSINVAFRMVGLSYGRKCKTTASVMSSGITPRKCSKTRPKLQPRCY
jgi:hypothetical protein